MFRTKGREARMLGRCDIPVKEYLLGSKENVTQEDFEQGEYKTRTKFWEK